MTLCLDFFHGVYCVSTLVYKTPKICAQVTEAVPELHYLDPMTKQNFFLEDPWSGESIVWTDVSALDIENLGAEFQLL